MNEIFLRLLSSNLQDCQTANGYQCVAGIYPPEVPADGESVAWVVLRLTDPEGKPVPNAPIDISSLLGELMPFTPLPQTDSDGMAIMAIRAPLFPGENSTLVRFPSLPTLQLELGSRFCLPGGSCSNNQQTGEVDFRYSWSSDAPVALMESSPYYPEMDICGGQFAGLTRLDVSGQRDMSGVGTELIVQKFTLRVPNRDAGDHFNKDFYPHDSGGCRNTILLPCLDCNAYNQSFPSPIAFALSFMNLNHLPGGLYESHSLYLPVDTESVITAHWIRYSWVGSRAGQKTLSSRSNNLRIEMSEDSPTEFVQSENPAERRVTARVNLRSGQNTRPNAPNEEKAIVRVMVFPPNSGPQVISQSRVSIPAENIEIQLPSNFPEGVYPFVVDTILPVSRSYYTTNNRDVDSTHSYWNRLSSTSPIREFETVRNAPLTTNFYALQPLGFQSSGKTFDFQVSYSLQSEKPTQGASGQIKVFDAGQRLIHTHELQPHQLRIDNNGPLYYSDHTVTVKIPENQMARFGRYHFVLEVFDNAGQLYKVAQNKRAFPAKASQVYDPPKINLADFQVVFSNQSPGHDNDIERASPYVNDVLQMNVIIRARDSQGSAIRSYHYYPFVGNQPYFSPGNNSRNDGGEQKSFDAPYRVATNTLPWPGPKLDFQWYELVSAVNQSSARGPVSRKINGSMHRYFVYPEYRTLTLLEGNQVRFDTPGTRRVAVRVGYQDKIGARKWNSSPSPTPGRYRSGHNQLQDLTHPPQPDWSFNCDSSEELAVRVSVRSRLDEVYTQFKREFLEWCTSFLKTPYEWGGGWYGGRADAQANRTGIDNGDEGYGIDCSGLVSSAAGLAGADWGRTKRGTYGLLEYSTPIDVTDLEPGDILLKPGSHAVVVLSVRNDQLPNGRRETIVDIIESVGEFHSTRISGGQNLDREYLRRKYEAQELRN
ncbi:MAG: hypothetical protein KIT45_09790 [Fimbriimonadia bacterium]|nr:hypothetical protein [Fimbriimonadia bacterium]